MDNAEIIENPLEEIPDSVIEIGKGAFTKCAALETVIISISLL